MATQAEQTGTDVTIISSVSLLHFLKANSYKPNNKILVNPATGVPFISVGNGIDKDVLISLGYKTTTKVEVGKPLSDYAFEMQVATTSAVDTEGNNVLKVTINSGGKEELDVFFAKTEVARSKAYGVSAISNPELLAAL